MARILLCLWLLGLLGGCVPGGPGFTASAGCALRGARCAKPALPPAPYCTRSLADVDCWADPRRLADRPPQVADGGWQAPALGRSSLGASAPASGQGRGAVVPAQPDRTSPAGPARSPAAGRPEERPIHGAAHAVPPGGPAGGGD